MVKKKGKGFSFKVIFFFFLLSVEVLDVSYCNKSGHAAL